MSVFVLRTQFSLGEELGSGVALGSSLMTCRFPWALSLAVWMGTGARCPIRPWWCCGPVLCVVLRAPSRCESPLAGWPGCSGSPAHLDLAPSTHGAAGLGHLRELTLPHETPAQGGHPLMGKPHGAGGQL